MNNIFKKQKANLNINYHTKNDQELHLFNCTECGFHGKVISKMWIKGNEDDVIVKFIEIHPQYFKESAVIGKGFKTDGELVEELICGHCGKTGGKKPVSIALLKLHGLNPDEPIFVDAEAEYIKDEKYSFKGLLNKIKEKLINIRQRIENELD